MNKNLLPWQLLTLLALALPPLYLLYAWPNLPSQVPWHHGFIDQINGYRSRNHYWVDVSVALGIALLSAIPQSFNPKPDNDASFQKLRLAVVSWFGANTCYHLYTDLHPGVASGRGSVILLGLFFTFLGYCFTSVPPNYFLGFRTYWTLASPAVWTRTNRASGILLGIGGLLMIWLAFTLPLAWLQNVMLALLLGTLVFSYIYSYVVFRQEKQLSVGRVT